MGGIKSSLIEFDLSKDTCFICGNKATSLEHIIPKWLQRKFNLWDEKIEIPSLTKITYKQLVVPSCKKCNNEIYGKLEDKVSRNEADDKDLWRWANKIHFGLRLKDNFLDFDRRLPGGPAAITDVTKDLQLNVYPNPFADDLNINLAMQGLKTVTFTINNPIG